MNAVPSHTVLFTPSGIRTETNEGESLYDSALRAGVDLRSICGGKGLCKRCQVKLSPGKHAKFKVDVLETHLGRLTPTEKKAMAEGELTEDRRLACRAKVYGDVVVDVPDDSREHETSISKKSTQITTDINPSVKLYMCRLAVPSLEDNPSDAEALSHALEGFGVHAKAVHSVLVKLQSVLAQNERSLIAVVRDGHQVIDVWPPSASDVYGAAIDIGSTSVALYVYNLANGTLVYEKAAMNPQIRFGEDLMSRVSYIMMNKGGEHKLTAAIQEQMAIMLKEAVAALEIKPEQLLEVTAVGNPIMHHLFLGLSPVELGQAPFTLTVKDWVDVSARKLDLGLSEEARISFLPLIGGHVGADTTGAYLTQIDTMKGRSVLLVDIGTNAEIVLSHKGRVAAASSPTGPAFEGAEISHGVRASIGAIERVRIDANTKQSKFKVIGYDEWLSDLSPDFSTHNITGICGSGIFEVMVELANAGLIDESGLFVPDAAPDRFIKDGKSWKYVLANRPENPITIKQTDIRAVQLAKAALSAGVSLLSEYLSCDAFDEVLLAGAFGTHLDPHYVVQIGIIPGASAENTRSIGNAAGMGAAMALLNVDEKTKIIEAVTHIEKLETAMEPKFQGYFVGAMRFPTAPVANQKNKTRRRRRNTQERS